MQHMPLQSLVRAIQDLSRAHTVEDIAAIVRVTARRLTGADGATFVLKEGAQCYYMDEDAIAPLWKGKRFVASSCISGWAMEHRRAVVIEDIHGDARIPQDAYRPTFVKSLVMVPIRSSDPIGAIGNYWASPHSATEQELEILQALADSTAIAMENAHLHADMQRQIAARTRDLEQARDHAERVNAAKSRFLAAASHNLRQPIQTLSTVATILDRVQNVQDSREHLQSMHLAIRNMESMLDTLLDLHRLEAGAIQPQPADCSLESVLARLRSEFAYVANAKSLTLDIPQDVPPVHTDMHLLQEILRNFLSNAIKYTTRGSVRLECRDDGANVTLTVADTGPGIPAPYLSRIFDAFYRAPDAEAGAGLGLGLSIAEQLARILQHRIGVESKQGVGSRFSITVPRAQATVIVERPAQPARAPTGGVGRILYIEDHPGVRQSIATLLGIEGYEVVAVATGAEALRAVHEGRIQPQMIISDFHLPAGETGEQVVERVRETLACEVPALLLTGKARDNRDLPSAQRSTHHVLYKPVDADVLLDKVASLLAATSERSLGAAIPPVANPMSTAHSPA